MVAIHLGFKDGSCPGPDLSRDKSEEIIAPAALDNLLMGQKKCNGTLGENEKYDLIDSITREMLEAKGVAAEMQKRADRQSFELQAALEKVGSEADNALSLHSLKKIKFSVYIASFSSQIDALASESNDAILLRQKLAQKSEEFLREQTRHQEEIRISERCIMELQQAAVQASARYATLETERDGLKQKVQSLLCVSQQCQIGKITIDNGINGSTSLL